MQGLAVTPPCFIFVEYFLPRLKEYFCWVVFFEIRVDVEAETLQSLHNEVDECLLPWKSGESNAEKRLVVDVFFDVDVVVLCSQCSRQSEGCLLEPQKNYWLQKNMNVPVPVE